MITAVPPDMPPTTPVLIPAVATAVLLLLHMPLLVASDKVVLPPWHSVFVPVMGVSTITDTEVEVEQPVMVV